MKEFVAAGAKKWKGLNHLLQEQLADIENAVNHLPRLYVDVRECERCEG